MAAPIQVGPLAIKISQTLNQLPDSGEPLDGLMHHAMVARYGEFISGITLAFLEHGASPALLSQELKRVLATAQSNVGSDRAHELEQLAANIAAKREGQTEH